MSQEEQPTSETISQDIQTLANQPEDFTRNLRENDVVLINGKVVQTVGEATAVDDPNDPNKKELVYGNAFQFSESHLTQALVQSVDSNGHIRVRLESRLQDLKNPSSEELGQLDTHEDGRGDQYASNPYNQVVYNVGEYNDDGTAKPKSWQYFVTYTQSKAPVEGVDGREASDETTSREISEQEYTNLVAQYGGTSSTTVENGITTTITLSAVTTTVPEVTQTQEVAAAKQGTEDAIGIQTKPVETTVEGLADCLFSIEQLAQFVLLEAACSVHESSESALNALRESVTSINPADTTTYLDAAVTHIRNNSTDGGNEQPALVQDLNFNDMLVVLILAANGIQDDGTNLLPEEGLSGEELKHAERVNHYVVHYRNPEFRSDARFTGIKSGPPNYFKIEGVGEVRVGTQAPSMSLNDMFGSNYPTNDSNFNAYAAQYLSGSDSHDMSRAEFEEYLQGINTAYSVGASAEEVENLVNVLFNGDSVNLSASGSIHANAVWKGLPLPSGGEHGGHGEHVYEHYFKSAAFINAAIGAGYLTAVELIEGDTTPNTYAQLLWRSYAPMISLSNWASVWGSGNSTIDNAINNSIYDAWPNNNQTKTDYNLFDLDANAWKTPAATTSYDSKWGGRIFDAWYPTVVEEAITEIHDWLIAKVEEKNGGSSAPALPWATFPSELATIFTDQPIVGDLTKYGPDKMITTIVNGEEDHTPGTLYFVEKIEDIGVSAEFMLQIREELIKDGTDGIFTSQTTIPASSTTVYGESTNIVTTAIQAVQAEDGVPASYSTRQLRMLDIAAADLASNGGPVKVYLLNSNSVTYNYNAVYDSSRNLFLTEPVYGAVGQLYTLRYSDKVVNGETVSAISQLRDQMSHLGKPFEYFQVEAKPSVNDTYNWQTENSFVTQTSKLTLASNLNNVRKVATMEINVDDKCLQIDSTSYDLVNDCAEVGTVSRQMIKFKNESSSNVVKCTNDVTLGSADDINLLHSKFVDWTKVGRFRQNANRHDVGDDRLRDYLSNGENSTSMNIIDTIERGASSILGRSINSYIENYHNLQELSNRITTETNSSFTDSALSKLNSNYDSINNVNKRLDTMYDLLTDNSSVENTRKSNGYLSVTDVVNNGKTIIENEISALVNAYWNNRTNLVSGVSSNVLKQKLDNELSTLSEMLFQTNGFNTVKNLIEGYETRVEALEEKQRDETGEDLSNSDKFELDWKNAVITLWNSINVVDGVQQSQHQIQKDLEDLFNNIKEKTDDDVEEYTIQMNELVSASQVPVRNNYGYALDAEGNVLYSSSNQEGEESTAQIPRKSGETAATGQATKNSAIQYREDVKDNLDEYLNGKIDEVDDVMNTTDSSKGYSDVIGTVTNRWDLHKGHKKRLDEFRQEDPENKGKGYVFNTVVVLDNSISAWVDNLVNVTDNLYATIHSTYSDANGYNN
jgi:hypothetical protein